LHGFVTQSLYKFEKIKDKGMSEWLEVRIPISPLNHYFNRVHMIAHSIRSLGGHYQDVKIRVSVGADSEPEDLHSRFPWSRSAGIEWVWVNRSDYKNWENTKHKYIATMMERYKPPFTSRQVLMLDADILVMREFDELSAMLDVHSGIAAVMAHVAPFSRKLDHAEWWQSIFAAAGIEVPSFTYEYSGWGILECDPSRRFGPPYFNTGTVLGTSSALEQLYDAYMQHLNVVRSVVDNYFFEQIALTLALQVTGIPTHVVPLRYNFPNIPKYDEKHRSELSNVRFLHFLKTEIVRRESDFETMSTIRELECRTDLTGSNEALRLRLSDLLPLMISDRL
jgi:hypothetical protein